MAGAFSLDLGTAQGRIASSYAPDGSYVFELGHANLDLGWLKTGDYHEVKQDIVADGEAAFVRARVRIQSPPDLVGYSWRLSARLNGVTRMTRVISAGSRIVTLQDIAIPLALGNTPPTSNEIAFRLELII